MTDFWVFAGRVLFAAACGLLVGIDREIREKPLGAQAYVLVALGSAALMVVTLNYAVSPSAGDNDVRIDPTRLIQGIVGGIGFLGAGAIMSNDKGAHLRGTGSGAAIWGAGAIGIASGLGYLLEAGFLAVTMFAVLNLYGALRKRSEENEES